MNKPVVRKLRCAVYTRKSSEEGLEQEFNSLHAQREACEAYIASQRSEGWVLVRDQYDDGGISGGTLERPGLKRLLADIEDGLVDVVVVYKIDRLSRSLMDFSKLVEVFDRNGVTFVSVTQSFNTTTSMGRLTLNILLSFAQFEREVTAERFRDKVRASRMKGIWMGGCPPLGYEVKNRKLVENRGDAAHVRWVFARFIEIGSGTELARELAARGVTTTRGHLIDKKFIYRMLNNRVYIGEAVHKGTSYPGEHAAIIDRQDWDKVHAILTESPRTDVVRGNWSAASELIDAALATAERQDQERRILFRDVPVESIRKFLVSTTISPHHMDLKTEHLLEYLDQVGSSLGGWNVGVILPKSATRSVRDLGRLGKITTMRRTQLENSPANYADIKALMSKRDILIDAEQIPPKPEGRSETWSDLKAVRPKVPLLLIYPIDGQSPNFPPSTSRKALDAIGDLVGFGMVFTGSKDRSGNWFSVELDAPAREQVEEDELAEIEDGTDGSANA